jgi:cyclophilin family peptidyl-prolyl cis-trans isomerase
MVILVTASIGLTILGRLRRDVAPNRPEKERMETESAGSPVMGLLRSPVKTYPALSAAQMEELKQTVAVVETDFGRFAFEFFAGEAPQTVQNFIWLTTEHFYDLQLVAGGMARSGIELDGVSRDPQHAYRVKAEFNQHPVEPGAVLLERAVDPAYREGLAEKSDYLNSGSTTVWVALVPNATQMPNCTVFGKVIEGLDVVRELSLAFSKGFPGYVNEVLVYRVRLVPRSQLPEVLAQPVEEPQQIPWAPQRTVLPPG